MIKNPCYRIYETPNKVIAVSSFAGQTVRGVAKCNTNEGDVYDEREGKLEAYKKVMAKYHKNLDSNLRAFLADVRSLAAGVEHYLDKKNVDYSKVPSVEELKASRFTVKDPVKD